MKVRTLLVCVLCLTPILARGEEAAPQPKTPTQQETTVDWQHHLGTLNADLDILFKEYKLEWIEARRLYDEADRLEFIDWDLYHSTMRDAEQKRQSLESIKLKAEEIMTKRNAVLKEHGLPIPPDQFEGDPLTKEGK